MYHTWYRVSVTNFSYVYIVIIYHTFSNCQTAT